MALGTTYNNNKDDKKEYSPTVYSQYGYGNASSTVDPTKLGISYWSNLLVLVISPKIPSSPVERPDWDYKGGVTIRLTHNKAFILYNEILKFQADPGKLQTVGVDSSKTGTIYLCDGSKFGTSSPCLVIEKLDETTGETISSIAYEFKQNYHYAMRNYENIDNFDKVYYNDLELEQLKILLKSYYEAMTYAMAYTVIEQSKYTNSKVNTKIDLIAEKLGVEFANSNGSNGKSSNSIFKDRGRNNFSSSSLDDIENQMV